MATIHVDGKEYEVKGSENLLEACLNLGLDIPYFCWHPALGSVGACRACAVKQYQNADDTRGRLVMSCMTPASDGAFISIDDAEAVEFRKNVVEWLMTNHPHDCPVCEEGGNCHLQDMTVMTGQRIRKYRFTKRTHNNQELGPFISHEMNRCIACYRCVRYYKDYAGGTDFGVYGAHDNVYFGRHQEGTLESEFAGNLVEVCPTGVFTDKTHSERYNRKWDMQFAPSICHQCSIGCNISPGERYGELRRIENRYNGTVNHHFLCDRGRFGYGYVNSKDRPRNALLRNGDEFTAISANVAVHHAADLIRNADKTIGIGSPRASLESNFALRQLVGSENFFSGISANEQAQLNLMLDVMQNSGATVPSLRDIESYDAVLVLGEDLTQTGARVALSVRQAVKGKAREMAAAQRVADWQILAVQNIGQHAKHPLFITNVDSTKLDDIAAWNYQAPVDEQARLGFAVAHGLDSAAPAVTDLNADVAKKVEVIVEALAGAKKPLIISGSHSGNIKMIEAAANVVKALKGRGSDVGVTFIGAEANSFGLAMLGGNSLDSALALMQRGSVNNAIVLENDLHRHSASSHVNAAINAVEQLIVVDHQRTALMESANLVFSAASFAEADGTLINNEGRAQRFFQVFDPAYYDDASKGECSEMLESWRWLHMTASAVNGIENDGVVLDDVIAEMANAMPQLQGVVAAAPDATFRIKGQKLARSPNRFSGRTSLRADINVSEQGQPKDKDTMFAFSMEGNNSPLAQRQQVAFAWAPGWNSPQAWNKFQAEVGGSLRYGDPGVRVLAVNEHVQTNYFTDIPNSFDGKFGAWRIAPYYHLFGSDEMSQRSDVILQRMPQAYVLMNHHDAELLKLAEGKVLSLVCEGDRLILPVRFSDSLMAGQLGLPLGLPGISPELAHGIVEKIEVVA